MRRVLILAGVAIAALVAPSLALADQGNPNTYTTIKSVTPRTPGLKVSVLANNDQFLIVYNGPKRVVIYGYTGDQYARILPGGIVQVNHNSPAYYLDKNYYGNAPVPKGITANTPPDWQTVDKTGRYEWHDHRMHYMGLGVPPQVKDQSVRQKVFDYQVPISVNGQKGAIAGSLLWIPRKQSGPPIAAIVALVAVLLASVALVVWIRRRRRDGGDGPGAPGGPQDGPGEDTTPPQRPTVEAW